MVLLVAKVQGPISGIGIIAGSGKQYGWIYGTLAVSRGSLATITRDIDLGRGAISEPKDAGMYSIEWTGKFGQSGELRIQPVCSLRIARLRSAPI